MKHMDHTLARQLAKLAPEEFALATQREAKRLIEGERDDQYGDPVENHRRISLILDEYYSAQVSPRLVAQVLEAVKISRELHKRKHDNMVDLCAYKLIGERIEQAEYRGSTPTPESLRAAAHRSAHVTLRDGSRVRMVAALDEPKVACEALIGCDKNRAYNWYADGRFLADTNEHPFDIVKIEK